MSRTSPKDDGFTITELLVAMTLLLLVSAFMAPLLLAGTKATKLGQLQTKAKNLNAARLAAMRNLPFHVAYQNGAFIDVLDEYYTNTSTAGTTITATGGTGTYVPAGTIPGSSATGAFYRVDFPASVLGEGFSQKVYSQFVRSNSQSGGAGNTPITPATSPTAYDSQATGRDQPPSLALAVTVVTTYSLGGSHSLRTSTEITDTGHDAPLVLAQAGTQAVSATTNAGDGSSLALVAGLSGADGTLSNGSNAAASAVAARFSRTDPSGTTSYPQVSGANGQVNSPPDPASTADLNVGGTTAPAASSTCSWGSVNGTTASNISATVAGGQPRVPSTVQDATAPSVTTSVLNGQRPPSVASGCGALWFSSSAASASTVNANLLLGPTSPALQLPESGSTTPLTTAASVDTPNLATGQPVKAKARVTFGDGGVLLFPGAPFVSDGTYNRALVVLLDLTASINCTSTAASATISYSGKYRVWQGTSATTGAYSTAVPFSYNGSGAPSAPSLAQVVTYSGGLPVPLSRWISSWQFGSLVQQSPLSGTASVGSHVLPGIVTIDTAPLLQSTTGVPDVNSDLLLNLGRVSCASEDRR